MDAPGLTHLPDEKHTWEEMGLGVLITSCYFQSLIW